jgi:hypothetical protein
MIHGVACPVAGYALLHHQFFNGLPSSLIDFQIVDNYVKILVVFDSRNKSKRFLF